LNLRDLWKHEERDFTPWLAEHIEDLSALLQLPIVVDQIEHKVGIYELDMLGHVEESDAIVIIENQLQATDHSHLGQLITYAAGLEAAIVVWIAPEVQDEHRAAVEWLNKHTGVNVSMAQGSRMRVEIYCATDPEKQLFHTLYGRRTKLSSSCVRRQSVGNPWKEPVRAVSRYTGCMIRIRRQWTPHSVASCLRGLLRT
jgi:hypothetical protein